MPRRIRRWRLSGQVTVWCKSFRDVGLRKADALASARPGGRCCINVANLGRRPYIPLHSFVIGDMLALGFLMRDEVIWAKDAGGIPSTTWRSRMSANNPRPSGTLTSISSFLEGFVLQGEVRQGERRQER